MPKLIIFNKPFDVLSQFTDHQNRPTLADYIPIQGVYPAGRLDRDSEGLLLLTDNGPLQAHISHPKYNKWKTYWAQLDGNITDHAIKQLEQGVTLKDGLTKPAKAKRIQPPELWPRNPPVRFRANIPTSWIELSICEGKNRQVRRMTAAVGFPTLRLVRQKIDHWQLSTLQPGEYQVLDVDAPKRTAATSPQATRYNKDRTQHRTTAHKTRRRTGIRTTHSPAKRAKT